MFGWQDPCQRIKWFPFHPWPPQPIISNVSRTTLTQSFSPFHPFKLGVSQFELQVFPYLQLFTWVNSCTFVPIGNLRIILNIST